MEPMKYDPKHPTLVSLIESVQKSGGVYDPMPLKSAVSYRTFPTYEMRIAICCEELKSLCDAYCLPRGC